MDDKTPDNEPQVDYIWGLHLWLNECSLNGYTPYFKNKSYSDLFELTEDSFDTSKLGRINIMNRIRELKENELAIYRAKNDISENNHIARGIQTLFTLIPSTKAVFLDKIGTIFADVVTTAYNQLDNIENDKEREDCTFKMYVISWRGEYGVTFQMDDKYKFQILKNMIKNSAPIRTPSWVITRYM